MRVGFIGLGHMGAPMCTRVLQAGFAVTAFDLRPGALRPLAALGAQPASSARECAAGADLVITMLPDPAAVEAVLLGERGVLEALAPGALAVDMSTSSPDLARRIAEAGAARGVGVLDAPVADALKAAKGELQVFVGGDPADL